MIELRKKLLIIFYTSQCKQMRYEIQKHPEDILPLS